MRALIVLFLGLSNVVLTAQTDFDLAESYFDKGDFEKALYYYKKLREGQPNNSNYVFKFVEIQQQLKQFAEAQNLLESQYNRTKNPQFLVELGHHFQLQNKTKKAIEFYNSAIDLVAKKPAFVYAVALRFEAHSLVDQAISVYKIGLEINQNLNYEYRLAGLYAEKKDIENMFLSYLNFTENNPSYLSQILRLFGDYITDDKASKYNQILKRIVLQKLQNNSDAFWTNMLSWIYIQQNDFKKALLQEQALFRRDGGTLQSIIDIGLMAKESQQYKVTSDALNFVLDNTQETKLKIEAKRQLLMLEIQHVNTPNYGRIQSEFTDILNRHGISNETLETLLSYAEFLTFQMSQSDVAINRLKSALNNQISAISKARVKLKLADILVSQSQFNRALIYYTQVHTGMKNSTLAQQARLKAAKTSYYKGDFGWAETQLKVLKSSTSQLIANDALDLQLLISDHKFGDSLQAPLRLYAKADFLSVQNKNQEAINSLNLLVETYPTHAIVDQALLFQAKLFEATGDLKSAEEHYLKIITNYPTEILIDDAYFSLAELYRKKLNSPQKAKVCYEKIMFNHQDSIHFVESKKHYRLLRNLTEDLNTTTL